MSVYTMQRKPLAGLPSPTLTNPDMVLPKQMSYEASIPRSERPPSPSYLRAPAANLRVRKSSRGNLGAASSPGRGTGTWTGTGTGPGAGAGTGFASSPTLNVDNGAWDQHRLSFAASSVMTEDLDSMQMPKFATHVNDSGDEESEFDFDTPSEVSYGAEVRRRDAEHEQSSATLMRAEMILANAKKRLNLMDQNLRGAREAMTPLTTANLQRATSFGTRAPYTRPISYAQQSRHVPPVPKHARVLSEPDASPGAPSDRRNISLSVSASPSWTQNPVRATRSTEGLRPSRGPLLSPDPTLASLPEDTIPEHHKTARSTSSTHNLREQVLQLRGRISSLRERAQEDSLRRQSSSSLRQSPCLLNDAAPHSPTEASATSDKSTSPRPRLVRITRDNAMPGAWVSTQTIEHDNSDDSNTPPSGSGSTERTYTPESVETATTTHSHYQEARQSSARERRESTDTTRHEDRADAFDYSKFFLHSATGSFTQPRVSSPTSSSSGHTARGHSPSPLHHHMTHSQDEEHPTNLPRAPVTPAALGHIESKKKPTSNPRTTQSRASFHSQTSHPRTTHSQASHHSQTSHPRTTQSQASHRSQTPSLLKPPQPKRPPHRRGLSAESLASVATFETAASTHPSKIDDWFSRNSSPHPNNPANNPSHNPSHTNGSNNKPRTHTPLHQSRTPESPASVAIRALFGGEQGDALKDKELKAAIAVLEGLRRVVEGLKGEDGEERRRLKRRLDVAGRVLVGGTEEAF